MKLTKVIFLLVVSSMMFSGFVFAEDNPEQLVNAIEKGTDMTPEPKLTPEQNWEAFLAQNGWDTGLSNGGVIEVEGKDLFISSAVAFTSVRLGQPGWGESRLVAFESAEMEAKMKIIQYMSQEVEPQRALSEIEKAVWEDGQINKVKELNDVAESLKRIGKKSLALAEKELDYALRKLDPEYDPAKYAGKSPEDLRLIAEKLFKRQIKTTAMGTLVGAMTLYSTEGVAKNNAYKVLVGVLWSPKLNRLALSLSNDDYNIPPVTPNAPLSKQIPSNMEVLLGTFGTRVVIDEKGDYAILSYGQAQPRKTSPSRSAAALHDAKQIAANRARGMLVNFIHEGMVLSDSEASRELLQEFSDQTAGTATYRDRQKKIKSKRVKVKIKGLRTMKEWEYKHPDTEQLIAGAVVAWSPSSAAMSKRMTETMRNSSVMKKKQMSSGNTNENAGKASLESIKVDTSAY